MEEIKKLVTVTDLSIINDLSNKKDIILLYPLKSFCVGYDLYFDIDEIDGYVLVNRILENDDIDRLKIILDNSNIKGIVFEDLGVIELVKNKNIEKILMLSHVTNNYVSINYYLDYVDSVIISTDLTKDEILEILNNAKKPLVLTIFGLNMLMYSRRLLLSNYQKYNNLAIEKNKDAKINDLYFHIKENEFGTVFFAKKYYNALELIGSNNVLYYFYNPIDLDAEQIKNVVLNNNIENIEWDTGFLYKKSIYKLKAGDIK